MAYKRISPQPVVEGGTGAQTLTNHAVLIGQATSAIVGVGPVASTGAVLQSNGVGSDPGFSTATYPITTTINQLLYSSAANTIVGLSTANNGTLVTSAAGVPSILAGPGTTGNILQSNAAAAPSFSTATYPSVATGTGTILRADGTNWVATTATYPATTTINQVLYSSAANTVAGITASNNGVLISSATGVPSWLAAGTTGQVLTATTGSPPSWAPAAGTGDVVGPGSATDNAIARFDGTTGKLIQNSTVTIDDTGNITDSNSAAGATLSMTLSNTSNTASSNALHQVTVAGTSAGDAFTTYTVSGTTNWSLGIDNSDSDAFALAASTALGTTNVIRSSTAGENNYPLQPAFLAYQAGSQTNATGNGAEYTLGTTSDLTEIYDQNSDFNPTTGTFTAPVTGRYLLNLNITLSSLTSAMTTGRCLISSSNRTYVGSLANCAAARTVSTTADTYTFSCHVIADMDSADTATFSIAAFGGAGNTAAVSGALATETYVSGGLLF